MGQGDIFERERRSDPTSFRRKSTHFPSMPPRSCRSFRLRHSATNRFRLLTSHGFPCVVEVEHDGPAIRGQPPGIQFAPANDVLLCVFTGSLRPRHFADECAHGPLAVSLLNLTMPKVGV
jgi:hypothetical protein